MNLKIKNLKIKNSVLIIQCNNPFKLLLWLIKNKGIVKILILNKIKKEIRLKIQNHNALFTYINKDEINNYEGEVTNQLI